MTQVIKNITINNSDSGTVYSPNGMFEALDFTKRELMSTKFASVREKVKDFEDPEMFRLRILRYKNEWYGTTDMSKVMGEKTSFLFQEKMNEMLEKFEKRTDKVDVSELNQKKTLEFNDRSLGTFSFDLASLGLVPVVEYYSPYLETVVSGNLVRSRVENDKRIFYHINVDAVPEHALKDKGTHLYSPILGININREDALARADSSGNIVMFYPERKAVAEHDVIQRQVKSENGRPKFTSTNRKSFIFLQTNPKRLPQIDIILSSSFSWKIKADSEMLYNALPVIALMKVLEKSSVKCRVFIIATSFFTISSKSELGDYNTTLIKIKDINDPIDYNSLAINTSDGRFFRYEMFKNSLASLSANGFGKNYLGNMGIPINDRDILTEIFNDTMVKAKDFGQGEKSDYTGKASGNKLIFPVTLSEDAAFKAFDEAILKIKSMIQ